MLRFVWGMVVGGGLVWVVYRFRVIPKWRAAVELSRIEVFSLRKKLGDALRGAR